MQLDHQAIQAVGYWIRMLTLKTAWRGEFYSVAWKTAHSSAGATLQPSRFLAQPRRNE